jgi:hypothetical protein
LLLLSTPLDLVAARLAKLRMKPLAVGMWTRRALWPAAGLAALAVGWWEMRHGGGWGPMVAAACACAFAEAARIEKSGMPKGGDPWLISRRNSVFLTIPFAIGGIWTTFLLVLLAYAAISFFIVQRVRHSPSS